MFGKEKMIEGKKDEVGGKVAVSCPDFKNQGPLVYQTHMRVYTVMSACLLPCPLISVLIQTKSIYQYLGIDNYSSKSGIDHGSNTKGYAI